MPLTQLNLNDDANSFLVPIVEGSTSILTSFNSSTNPNPLSVGESNNKSHILYTQVTGKTDYLENFSVLSDFITNAPASMQIIGIYLTETTESYTPYYDWKKTEGWRRIYIPISNGEKSSLNVTIGDSVVNHTFEQESVYELETSFDSYNVQRDVDDGSTRLMLILDISTNGTVPEAKLIKFYEEILIVVNDKFNT